MAVVDVMNPTAARTLRAWIVITHSPNAVLTNRKRAKDRATYLGAIDHPSVGYVKRSG